MEALQNRIDSFAKPIRVKIEHKPSSFVPMVWPHITNFIATPETLAEAGFYYSPSYEDPDNVICYICGKQLSDWEPDDDPFDIHWKKCGMRCCWASVRCGLRGDMDRSGRYVFPDKTRLPTSKAMENMRLDTFTAGNGWMHDRDKNHGANSRKMAHAGFVYTPQEPGDDLATCLYCNVSLSGWDADDDPMEEHRKRDKKSGNFCPFFSSSSSTPTEFSHSAKPPSKSQIQRKPSSSKPPSSRSKHTDVTQPTKTHDGELDGDGDLDTAASSAKTPRKGRAGGRKPSAAGAKTPRTRTRSRSKVGLREVVEEEVEEEGDEEEAKAKAKKTPAREKSRSRSKSVVRGAAVRAVVLEEEATGEGEEEGEEEVVSKASRGKARVRGGKEEKEEPSRKPSRNKNKSKARAVQEEEGEEEQQQVEKGGDKDVDKQASAVRKPTRGKTKAKANTVQEQGEATVVEDEGEDEGKPPAKPVSKGIKSKPKPVSSSRNPSRSKPKPVLPVEEEEEEFPALVLEKRQVHSTTSRPFKSKFQQASEDEVMQMEEDVETIVYAPRIVPSKPASTAESVPELPPLFVPKRSTKSKEQRKENETGGNDESFKKPSPKGTDVAGKQVLGKGKGENEIEARGRSMKVVEISTDEEEEGESGREVQDRKKERVSETEKGKSGSKPVLAHVKTQVPRPIQEMERKDRKKGIGNSNEKQVIEEMAVAGAAVSQEREEEDVEIAGVGEYVPPTRGQEERRREGGEEGEEEEGHKTREIQEPMTPPRGLPLPSAPTLHPASVQPPLSMLPFTPLQNLTDAELEMTVEEWIRYQMEMEYDKFKRDGERELGRFRKRAEEVRKVIEGL